MREAHELAARVWPSYSHRFSRHDFTLPRLFACLVVREVLKLSYRKAEAVLADSPQWLAAVGLAREGPFRGRASPAAAEARRAKACSNSSTEPVSGNRRPIQDRADATKSAAQFASSGVSGAGGTP
jgi:hypothetical protein